MSPEPRSFERFSSDLDAEWLRDRLRATVATSGADDEEALAAALGREDPLAEKPRGWVAGIADALRTWPGRLGVAAAAMALLLVGVAIDRIAVSSRPRAVATAIPRPPYDPDHPRGLGATASVKPGSGQKFREAMALREAPDFAVRALPLLRDAVAEDPSNDLAQFWLGVALLLKGEPAGAVRPLEEARRLAPADVRYRQYLLMAYLQSGATDKALALQTDLLRDSTRPAR